MKPRHTHLLLAAVAVAAIAGGVAALRFMPAATSPHAGASAPRAIARAAAPMARPVGGGLLTGLRRGAEPESVARPAPEQAPITETPPAAPAPELESPAAAPAAPERPSVAEKPEVEGTVSFPLAIAPTPPARPADLASAPPPPTPPRRPGDLEALAGLSGPVAPPAQAPEAPSEPVPAAQAPEAAQEPARPLVAAPLPPTRPREFAAIQPAAPVQAAAPALPAAEAAAPAAPPAQVARLPEPTLRPAPDDAFQQTPPKFGMGDQVFVRIFKQEGQLELWLKKDGRFKLYKTYPICKWSGRLGPKIKEADYQSPEGFYSVSARQLNPHSNYHRAFNVGYPNAFDRQNGRTGGLVMVHGSCKSVGCFAMTDRGIDEIYGFVEAALRAGQKEIAVHIFPFRMTDAAIARETGGGWLAFVGGGVNYAQWAGFWRNLKQGYDLFEQTGEPPVAFACGDHYEFGGGGASCRRVAGW